MKAETKECILVVVALLLVFLGGIMFGFILSRASERNATTDEPATVEAAQPARPDPWELFIEALIWKESRGKETAIGLDDDAGVLQIRPCMVAEANRILGMETYTLNDRFSREKSIEMWSVVQDYHNPSHDVIKALKIQNPHAPKEYVEEVMRRFYTLVK